MGRLCGQRNPSQDIISLNPPRHPLARDKILFSPSLVTTDPSLSARLESMHRHLLEAKSGGTATAGDVGGAKRHSDAAAAWLAFRMLYSAVTAVLAPRSSSGRPGSSSSNGTAGVGVPAPMALKRVGSIVGAQLSWRAGTVVSPPMTSGAAGGGGPAHEGQGAAGDLKLRASGSGPSSPSGRRTSLATNHVRMHGLAGGRRSASPSAGGGSGGQSSSPLGDGRRSPFESPFSRDQDEKKAGSAPSSPQGYRETAADASPPSSPVPKSQQAAVDGGSLGSSRLAASHSPGAMVGYSEEAGGSSQWEHSDVVAAVDGILSLQGMGPGHGLQSAQSRLVSAMEGDGAMAPMTELSLSLMNRGEGGSLEFGEGASIVLDSGRGVEVEAVQVAGEGHP